MIVLKSTTSRLTTHYNLSIALQNWGFVLYTDCAWEKLQASRGLRDSNPDMNEPSSAEILNWFQLTLWSWIRQQKIVLTSVPGGAPLNLVSEWAWIQQSNLPLYSSYQFKGGVKDPALLHGVCNSWTFWEYRHNLGVRSASRQTDIQTLLMIQTEAPSYTEILDLSLT